MPEPSREPPTFSVVIAVRDGAATLQQCLDSVFGQREASVEVIVIDGGSTDGTVEIIERNAPALAHWRSEPDRGICDAWNKALGVARGEWILFLGADDELAGDNVLAEASALLPGPDLEARVAYGSVDVVAADGTIAWRAGEPWEQARRELLDHNTIPHQGVLHHRSLFELNGPFDLRFRIAGDYELLLREVSQRQPAYLDLTISKMGAGGISQREDSGYQATREAYRARYVNGLERLPEWASFRIARATLYELIRRTLGVRTARTASEAYRRVTSPLRRG
jgi:glycosyltransferase involved in cell wall biosynthesis